MSLICKSCNHINLDVALYCPNCGKKVIEEKEKKAKKIELERTSLSWLDIVLIFPLIILIIVLIILTAKDKNFIQLQDVFGNETIQKENDKYLLEVRATPSDSTISILESNQPYYKDILLDEGDYTIVVSHDGYKTFSKKIILKRNSYVTAKLEKNILEKTKKNIWECKIQWIIDNGEKYKPTNENLQTLSIELIDGADKLYLKTQNGESIYNYDHFIDLKDNNLGMEYTLGNRFISIFENKTLFLGSYEKGIDTKYYCQDMVLDIAKSVVPKNQKKPNSRTLETSIEKFSLTINPIPSKAQVRILNIKPRYYDGIKLKEGNYHIEISHDGYRTMKKWIKLDSDSSLDFQLKEISAIAIQSFDFSLHPGIGWRRNPYVGQEFNEKMDSFSDETFYLSISIPKEIYSDSSQKRDSYGRITFTVQNKWDDYHSGGNEYLIHLVPNDSNPFVFMDDIVILQGYYKIFNINGPRQGYMSINMRPARNHEL